MKKVFDDEIIDQLNRFEVDLPENDWAELMAKMPKKRRMLPLWQYGIAASVAILLGTGVLFVFKVSNSNRMQQSIAELSDHSQILPADSSWQQPVQTEDEPAATEQIYTTADKDDNNLSIKTEQTAKRKNKPRKYGKKRNMAIVPAEDAEQRTNRQEADSHYTPATDPTHTDEQKAGNGNKTKFDPDKSLDDYIEELNKNKQKTDPKRQRKELKEKTNFARNYYASVNTSISTLSGNIGDAGKPNGKLLTPDKQMFIASPYYSDKQHFLPVSFGVSVGVPLAANSLYLNTGLKYTYLYSKIKNIEIASNKLVSVKEQHLHYLGIPIALSYHFVNNRLLKAYIAGGTTIEHGVLNNNTYKNYTKEGTIETTDKDQTDMKGLLISLNAKAGAGITIIRGLDFYLEPEFSWYIPNSRHPQPESKLTENPFVLSVAGGLRWNF